MRRSLSVSLAVAMLASLPHTLAEATPRPAAATPPPPAATLRAAEWKAIRSVIVEQLAALKSGNGARAFAHASPGIRQQFGTPENFLAMVRAGYGALLTARYTAFLEGAVIEGTVVQPLRIVGPDNTVLVALYTMQKQPEGRWKIAGCVLAPSTVQAA